MDSATKQSLQALDYYHTLTPLEGKHILIIGSAPSQTLKSLSYQKLDVITYSASLAHSWNNLELPHCTLNPQKLADEYDLIIHVSTKFQTQNQAQIGRFSQHLSEQGLWISISHNKLGAKSTQAMVQELFGKVSSLSKSKCRVISAFNSERFDTTKATLWAQYEQLTAIDGTPFYTYPGIFSADKIDRGSEFLAQFLKQESWYGIGADFGAGYGYLSHQLLSQRNKIQEIHLYDLDSRASVHRI